MQAAKVLPTGKKVTRETLDKNALVTAVAIKHLGNRVSVDTCTFHIELLYSFMKIAVAGRRGTYMYSMETVMYIDHSYLSYATLPGGVPGAQGWILRRCIAAFNQIAGRPHTPREKNIRWMLEFLGVELPKKMDDDEDEDADEDAYNAEEGGEEEVPTTDEECWGLWLGLCCPSMYDSLYTVQILQPGLSFR